MKRLICEVCEKKKPFTAIKRGRYCCMLVCDDCRNDADEGDKEEDEQWLVVDADGCGYLS